MSLFAYTSTYADVERHDGAPDPQRPEDDEDWVLLTLATCVIPERYNASQPEYIRHTWVWQRPLRPMEKIKATAERQARAEKGKEGWSDKPTVRGKMKAFAEVAKGVQEIRNTPVADPENDAELLEEYARLLRRAWLHQRYRPWQDSLHSFEREHDRELSPYYERWKELDNADNS